jgi:hypothetical protein
MRPCCCKETGGTWSKMSGTISWLSDTLRCPIGYLQQHPWNGWSMQRNWKGDEPTAAVNAPPPEPPALPLRLPILDERIIAAEARIERQRDEFRSLWRVTAYSEVTTWIATRQRLTPPGDISTDKSASVYQSDCAVGFRLASACSFASSWFRGNSPGLYLQRSRCSQNTFQRESAFLPLMPASLPCRLALLAQRSGNRNQESQNSHLTLTENPLPYGCG